MNKRGLAITGLAALTLVAFAGLKGTALDASAQTLYGAKGLDVTYTLTVVGGQTSTYSVSLAKPNKARIDTPEMTVVADGKTITKYLKNDGVFFKKDQSDAELLSIFNEKGLDTWLPFFKDGTVDKFASVKDAGSKARGGVNYKVVNAMADAKGDTKMTYYIDPSDYLPKQAEITVNAAGRTVTTIMNAKSAKLTVPGDEVFAFKAPANAKEINEIDLVAGKWFLDFSEALNAAKVSNKLVMVDFMASWCGPCKMMDEEVFHSAPFKELTKNMILVKVDVDVQKEIAAKYGIEAMPTCKFLNSNGEVVHEFVGYGGPDQVLGEIKTAQSKFGR